MKTDYLSPYSVPMVPMAPLCEVAAENARTPSQHHAATLPTTPDPGNPSLHTQAQRLILVQENKVVCVVERHRHDSARSVARLLCRLLVSDSYIYACPRPEADRLRPEQRLEGVPEHWRELYHATPCTEPFASEAVPVPVVGIR